MGFKYQDDKIGSLSHSGGVISLAPSVLTIGGQQYRTQSILSLTPSGLSANTLYMIYAIVSGGVVSLVQSVNVNSIGPAGQLQWKLVGAFYSSGKAVIDFGAFVNIEGSPRTSGPVDNGPLLSTVHIKAATGGTDPTFGATTGNQMRWSRDGKFLAHSWEMQMTAAGTTGAGNYRLVFPFAADTSIIVPVSIPTGDSGQFTNQRSRVPGHGHITNGSSRGSLHPFLAAANSVELLTEAVYASYLMWYSGFYNLVSAQNFKLNIHDVPIAAWSETPLRDL